MANLKIEIENVYIRFEDEQLEFCIGLLVPEIKCLSTDEHF